MEDKPSLRAGGAWRPVWRELMVGVVKVLIAICTLFRLNKMKG